MDNDTNIKHPPTWGDLGALFAEAEAERERNRVQIALGACLGQLPDRKKEIEALFEEQKRGVAMENAMIILGSEIEQAVHGKMIVPEYSQKSCAKQQIYVFIGTHWEVALIQVYYDFVKEAARRIGLSEIFVQNQKFMNQLFENVAFRVSKHIATVQPHDGVWVNLKNCTVEISRPSPLAPSLTGRGSDMLGPSPLAPSLIGRGSDMHCYERPSAALPNEEIFSSGEVTTPPPYKGGGQGGRSVRVHAHRASDFFQYCLPYSYDPDADCPRWLAFLDEVLPEKEAQRLLGEYIGYCFTQNLKLEKMAVFHGGGANGKSVCLDVIKNLLGRSNVSEATLSSVTNDPETRAMLQHKLVNISSESGKNLNPAVLKMMISGEPVEMRILYVGTKLLYNPPKLITSYNELPPLENTLGYRRRWILFPFNKTIAADRQDPALAGKLCRELPGILNWVLGHLANLIARVNENCGEDFTTSRVCNDALNEYFKSANSVTMFLEEQCRKDDSVQNTMKELYEKYKTYCRDSGISKPCILKNFKKALLDWGAKETMVNRVKYFNVWVEAQI